MNERSAGLRNGIGGESCENGMRISAFCLRRDAYREPARDGAPGS